MLAVVSGLMETPDRMDLLCQHSMASSIAAMTFFRRAYFKYLKKDSAFGSFGLIDAADTPIGVEDFHAPMIANIRELICAIIAENARDEDTNNLQINVRLR
jgi:hypothetical protein